MNNKASVYFFGSPEFSVPTLCELFSCERIEVTAVITQPEKIRSRGHNKVLTPVGIKAEELSIPLFSPTSLKNILNPNQELDEEALKFKNFLLNNKPDFCVLVAYGKLIPEDLLQLPKLAFLNIHPSKLPRWRGAAPIQHTLMNGERNTEVCIIELIKELDAGPIYKKEYVEISDQENFGTLSERLGAIGARLVRDTILEILDTNLQPKPQEDTETTYASKIKKEDTIIDWNWSADKITNFVRSLSPQPVAKTTFNNKSCKIISCIQANSADIATDNIEIGKLYKDKINKNLFVGCGNKELVSINELQIEGKNSVKAAEFLNGLRDITKAYFT